jgi:hypothetical protein
MAASGKRARRGVVGDALGHGEEFGEGAGAAVLAAGDADDLAVVAEVDLAARQKSQTAAVDGGVEGDAIAGREGGYLRCRPRRRCRRPRGP